jgi:GH15 family glucan-1,4-alpha-glucosidase
MATRPRRKDGYLPIRDYAVIGDGRTAALVGIDGSIDWLCLPDVDSPSVFGAVLDSDRGGRFALAPTVPFRAARRYLPDTNVLETTYCTDEGSVRVTDALSLPRTGLAPGRELLRRIDGLDGRVPIGWRMEPRFGYGARPAKIGWRNGIPVATAGADALALRSWEAGAPAAGAGTISGRFDTQAGASGLLALSISHGEPLVLPTRTEAEARLGETVAYWQRWVAHRSYEGPWRDAVIRSALALKLLVYAPSGAIAAAATASLPEALGGERNWDYRYSWVRDAAFTVDALLALGCPAEADAYFSWLLHATQLTHPRLRVLYRLDGRPKAAERELALAGYRKSAPVRIGNAAAPQTQLDLYGELLWTAHRYVERGNDLSSETAARVSGIADEVCKLWETPDAGIWEVRSEPAHFTQSKVMCWAALHYAGDLAERGLIPARGLSRWRTAEEEVKGFIEEHCWSEEADSYVRHAGSTELDASLVFMALVGYEPDVDARLDRTLDSVKRALGEGSLMYRYRGEDGLSGQEGVFVACSFWFVEALVRRGRLDEAAELMGDLVALANDVGLYSEEIEPGSGEFLGNFPQALVHLALINAAVAWTEATSS